MKKKYMKPEIHVVLMKVKSLLMTSGEVGDTSVRMGWEDNADNEEYGL